eukprot:217242-Chlamydomonas_euryale.AAC.3
MRNAAAGMRQSAHRVEAAWHGKHIDRLLAGWGQAPPPCDACQQVHARFHLPCAFGNEPVWLLLCVMCAESA